MATLLPEGKQSFTNGAGAPLVGGKIYTYDAGTAIPRPTYQDAAGTTPNTNPIILDARGEATVFWSGAYKVVLKDSADVIIWTVDNVLSGNVASDTLRADLVASSGASTVGYLPAGMGAVATTVQGKLRDRTSVFDFMTPAQVADVVAETALIDVTAAINTALQTARDVELPKGTYRVTGSLLFNINGQRLWGHGSANSKIKFDPPAAKTLCLVQAVNPAQLIQQITLRDFGVYAVPSAFQKRGIVIFDGSFITVEGVNTLDNSWTGSTSWFFQFNGRDQHTIRNCGIAADIPVYVSTNPNSTIYQFDVFHFQDLSMQVLDPTQYAITFAPGVNISQWVVDGRTIVLQGKGGIYLSNSNVGTSASSMISIDNFRVESGTQSGGSAGGYAIYMNFGASNPKCGNIKITNSSVNDGSCNGYSFNGVAAVELTNVNCGFAAGNLALTLVGVNSASITSLGVGNNSAVVTLDNMFARYVSKPYSSYGNPTNPSIDFGLYAYYDADAPNRNQTYVNGVRNWARQQSIANGASMGFPNLVAGGSQIITISCDFGYAQYFVNFTTAVLISGTAGFGVGGAGNITMIAGAGAPYLTNQTAGTQIICATVVGT
jgi:hypothetical protein